MMKNILLIVIISFVIQSNINGVAVSKDESFRRNKPYENPNRFEGDIDLPPISSSEPTARGLARLGSIVPWPNGIVPYVILPGYAVTQENYIIATMRKMESLFAINNVPCIQFREKNATDQYYINIINGDGCSSPVGRYTGYTMNRTVNLQYPGCIDDGRIMHELLHTLGFYHEQSRWDRDNYVRINFTNIQPGMTHNFEKYNSTYTSTLNTSYDYASVMHYENDAFSVNGYPTIETIQGNFSIGQRDNMSDTDIYEVRLFYNCSSTGGVTLPPTTSPTTVNLYVTNTTISSSLTSTSSVFRRYPYSNLAFYYETYLVIVPVTGYYLFTSISSINTYGYFYATNFSASSPSTNLIAYDDNSGGNNQFQIIMSISANTPYVLVVTTYGLNVQGS
ncbi:unnamed protein product, partial [Rotaria sordida]